MRRFMTFSSRSSRRLALIPLFALMATVLNAVPAAAAPATHLEILGIDKSMTAHRETNNITVRAEDDANAVDTNFGFTPQTVTFSADCGDCFTITPNNSGSGGSATQYTYSTFQTGEMGTRDFALVWKESAAGTPRTLTVSAPSIASDSESDINVLSNAPAALDLSGVQSLATAGSPQAFTVTLRNPQGQTNPNPYTGVVTFSASCGDCFTVTPNNSGSGGNAKQYTFVAGDNSTRNFQLTWTNAAVGSGRTFTAEGSGLAAPNTDDAETQTGITVQEAPATTTTSTSTSTTTTTIPRTKAAQVVTGAGQGGGPHVIVRRASNPSQILHSFFAYTAGFSGGVRVATGDVNGDGYDDIITAPGPGGGPHIKVFSGNDLVLLREFMAYEAGFGGGVYIASSDVDNDGKDDIITGPGAGGGPHVQAFSGADGAVIRSFFAYEPGFTGGVRVAAGRFDNNNTADIVTAPGPGGGPHIRLFSGGSGAALGGFMAYNTTFTGGVFPAADRADEGIFYTGAGPGGGPHVRLFDSDGEVLGFMAGTGTNGAVPAVGESTSDASNVFVVARAQADPTVRFYSLTNGAELPGAFTAYAANVGVFVAVGVL